MAALSIIGEAFDFLTLSCVLQLSSKLQVTIHSKALLLTTFIRTLCYLARVKNEYYWLIFGEVVSDKCNVFDQEKGSRSYA